MPGIISGRKINDPIMPDQQCSNAFDRTRDDIRFRELLAIVKSIVQASNRTSSSIDLDLLIPRAFVYLFNVIRAVAHRKRILLAAAG